MDGIIGAVEDRDDDNGDKKIVVRNPMHDEHGLDLPLSPGSEMQQQVGAGRATRIIYRRNCHFALRAFLLQSLSKHNQADVAAGGRGARGAAG